ncbi:MAG TPA: hypothetical protein VEL76_33195, partial [Gemmataceae bacterium]|nr:hypothetical protein [Gemmataceae bacterium]
KALLLLGNNLARQRKDIEAESVMRAYLTIQEKKQPVAWGTFEAKSVLGVCLANQQKYAEAEPLLLEGYKGLKERASAIPARIRMAYLTSAANRLVQLYQVWGNQERADQWREELGRLKGAGTN